MIQKAQEIALGMKHQSIENAHLLRAILTVDDNVVQGQVYTAMVVKE